MNDRSLVGKKKRSKKKSGLRAVWSWRTSLSLTLVRSWIYETKQFEFTLKKKWEKKESTRKERKRGSSSYVLFQKKGEISLSMWKLKKISLRIYKFYNSFFKLALFNNNLIKNYMYRTLKKFYSSSFFNSLLSSSRRTSYQKNLYRFLAMKNEINFYFNQFSPRFLVHRLQHERKKLRKEAKNAKNGHSILRKKIKMKNFYWNKALIQRNQCVPSCYKDNEKKKAREENKNVIDFKLQITIIVYRWKPKIINLNIV